MHEFSAVQQVLDDLEKRPRNIKVKLGAMKAEKEVFLNTLKEMRKGTNLENIRIETEKIEAKGRCECGFEGDIKVPGHVHFLRCPNCSKICKTIKGNELIIEDLEDTGTD